MANLPSWGFGPHQTPHLSGLKVNLFRFSRFISTSTTFYWYIFEMILFIGVLQLLLNEEILILVAINGITTQWKWTVNEKNSLLNLRFPHNPSASKLRWYCQPHPLDVKTRMSTTQATHPHRNNLLHRPHEPIISQWDEVFFLLHTICFYGRHIFCFLFLFFFFKRFSFCNFFIHF